MLTPALLRSSGLFVLVTVLASPALAAVNDDVVKNYAHVPLHFEANQGQARDDVKFLARGPGYGVYLTANEALLALSPVAARGEQAGNNSARADCTADGATLPSRVLRMSLVGGAKTAPVSGVDERRAKANYFVGADASKWRTNIPIYAKIRYEAVYPGIDLVYYGNERQLEYDFVLAPSADPRKIELQFDGADRVEIDANGDLVLRACGREIRQPKPTLYQDANGRREVTGGYVRKGKNRIGFAVAAYDRTLPLIIDPIVLSYASYFGGTGGDGPARLAVDASGDLYVAGTTNSIDLPTTAGAVRPTSAGGRDAFVAKFDPSGTRLVYSTYLGGSSDDTGTGIAVDAAGNVYVSGSTASNDFPTSAGALGRTLGGAQDAFVAKLNATGSALMYSTYLGGSDLDRGAGLAVDASGAAYTTGSTTSSDFPTTSGAAQTIHGGGSCTDGFGVVHGCDDAFVTKLNDAGTLVYSTYLGGNTLDYGFDIAVDGSGNSYVTGQTYGDFPTSPGAFQPTRPGFIDGFVTKFDPTGSTRVYSTYLGGGDIDGPTGIAVNGDGEAYVTGSTGYSGPGGYFPTTPGAFQTTIGNNPMCEGSVCIGGDAFVTKFNSTGTGLVFSTYLGGNDSDYGGGIALDAAGNVYVTGSTWSTNFPTTADAAQSALVGYKDVFIAKLDPTGSTLRYSTYLGGHEDQSGASITLDAAAKNIWIVGYTRSNDFPTTPNAYQPHGALGPYPGDVFIVKLGADVRTVPGTLEAENLDEGGEGVAYHDKTPGNQGDAGFRTGEDVDIFVSNDVAGGGRIVKNFEAGEWLAYTISVPADGNYNIELRASTHPAFPNPAYHLELDGANVTGTVTLPDTGGWDNYEWLGTRTLALTSGTHVLKLVSEQAYFNLNSVRVGSTVASAPYFGAPTAVPGEFEAEAFDRGGEGVAYHDNAPGNQGNSGSRDGEDVDIFVSNDAASGSPYIVKSFETGEWLAYSISVSAGGDYDIELRASTNPAFPNSAYHVEVDGTNATGTVVLADTGDWDNYQWLGRKTVALTAGTHVLKLVAEQPYFNLNSLRVTATGTTGPAPNAIPGQIEAEDFAAGGEGVAYHDNAPGNQGDAGFRTGEDVDIFRSNDGGSGSWYIVKNFEASEWLVYAISVPASGNYDVELRASTDPAFPNSAYHLEVDGTNVTGTVALPNTGGWDNYQWLGKTTVALTAGVHTLTITAEQPYFNFNALRVLHSSP